MARYIDADAFEQRLTDKDIFFPALYKNELDDIPTADVVPKSEVDKWKEINEQLHKEMSERMIAERKIERNLAVLQIIGEILSRHTPDADGFLTIHKAELAELKKKYTEGL